MSKKPKLTPWLKRGTKPAHVGVYDTENGFQNWNGQFWGYFTCTVESAAHERNAAYKSISQSHRWRGLAADPKGGK